LPLGECVSKMTWFEAYTLRRLLVPMIAIGYAMAAIHLKPAEDVETFPFFNWSLFSTTASVRSDVVVMVRRVDGRQVDPPGLYYDMIDTFASAKSRDIRLRKASLRLARALRSNDATTAAALRSVIEQTFMRDAGEVHYDLAIITYDPIVRRQSGAIDNLEVIASFTKGEP
jgi:hypothetical protein